MVRSCYEVDVAFWRDDPEKTERIQWYFVPKEKKSIPYSHPFGARVWDKRDEEPQTALGERQNGRKWRGGKKPYNFRGVGLCGTQYQWENGAALGDPPPAVWPLSNVPRCCPPPEPDPFALAKCCECCDDCHCNEEVT